MCIDTVRLGLHAGRPEDVPLPRVHGRQAELGRVLGEGDGVAALGRAAPDLLGGQRRVPQGNEGERDQATAAGAPRPLVDHPVVVDAQAGEGEVLVLPLEEALPGEAGEDVREVDGRLDVVERHVGQALGLVPGALAEVVVGGGHVALLVPRHPGRGVEQAGGHDQVVEDPQVTPGAVGVVATEAVVAAGELQLDLLGDHLGPSLPHRLGQLPLPQVLGLHDVVVDGDDQREVGFVRGDAHGRQSVASVAGPAPALNTARRSSRPAGSSMGGSGSGVTPCSASTAAMASGSSLHERGSPIITS